MAQATIDTTVTGLQGVPVGATPPTVGQALVFNGTSWVPSATINGAFSVSGQFTAGGLQVNGAAGIAGSLNASGNITTTGGGSISAAGALGGATLNVSGSANVGAVSTAGVNFSSSPQGYFINYDAGQVGLAVALNSGAIAWQFLANGYFQSVTGIVCHIMQGGLGNGGTLQSGNGANQITFGWGGGLWYNIDGVGWVQFTTASDERLKENLVPATVDALGIINALAVKEFDYKDKIADALGKPTHVRAGIVAQDMQLLIPEIVNIGCKQNEESILPDEMLSIDFQVLVPYLVKAIQQLSAEVARLKH